MPKKQRVDPVAFAKNWPARAKAAILHTLGLTETIFTFTRGWAANSRTARVRIKAELKQRDNEIAKLREELRIKDAWSARIDPKKRHHYKPCERMAILELKAARGWSLAQTARTFQRDPATIGSWLQRLDEEGAGRW